MDTSLFLAINHLPHTAITDAIALALSGAGSAGLIWFALAGWLFLREERKHHSFFLPIGCAGAASGIIVNAILKPLVARPRPDVSLPAIIVGETSWGYSFPSGHATMAFAGAVVLSKTEPRWRWALYTLAILISLSRIYLGQHYPLDVAAGAGLGWSIGHLSVFLCSHGARKGNRTAIL